MIKGYARVSTFGQSLDGQIEILKKNGCEKIYREKISGKDRKRPELEKMLSELKEGDLIKIVKLDRLARSNQDLLNIVSEIEGKKAQFVSINDPGIDTTTAPGRFMLQMLGAVAELERSMINDRMEAGKEIARKKGVKFGRPPLKTKSGRVLDPKVIIEKHNKGISATSIAKDLECSITPILKVIKASNSD